MQTTSKAPSVEGTLETVATRRHHALRHALVASCPNANYSLNLDDYDGEGTVGWLDWCSAVSNLREREYTVTI